MRRTLADSHVYLALLLAAVVALFSTAPSRAERLQLLQWILSASAASEQAAEPPRAPAAAAIGDGEASHLAP
jgi:hypothetical protein